MPAQRRRAGSASSTGSGKHGSRLASTSSTGRRTPHTQTKKQGTQPVTMLKDQPTSKKWRNWWIRGILSWTMIGLFAGVVYLGPLALATLILALQLKVLHEVISLGHKTWPRELPWFRSLNWYFVFAANVFFLSENFERHLYEEFADVPVVLMLLTRHRFISFCLYIAGFVTFVLSLKKGFYMFQFVQFGWTHLSLLIVASAATLLMRSIYEGLIWFLVPVCLVICNDIMAYMFGFFFGKTQLISLSPKKTWEGFLGAFASTVVFGIVFSSILSRFPFFTCPMQDLSTYGDETCVPPDAFHPQEFPLPRTIVDLLSLVGSSATTVLLRPAVLHTVALAVFASLIAPFGGFFASGLKRAFKIKDFDNLIPGHGGATDRFDCQLIMAFFFFVYYQTFIKPFNLDQVLNAIFALQPEAQVTVYERLQRHLQAQHAI
ncbi:phosphatidate cytidylyltransferase [Salpingoeca rosetta]|uniref:Phosphatidate cytidylyltransferase n=1 Tax=Salpingoeca rosetta (strain ATCC 50818 / BSB-021) TaxID=946362 RepID=F2UEK4_SALR5|nr:phosphatidate cytidylyltransferase [Salpingoeca rosetta]EGD75054.1 phosphatidate cytidylyltransferase [Salpingoeca rosetta]|eukprot:XP_004992107.1 phosphatidate cytidylyltransferase [Salpingoeca rosetta]